MSDDSQTTTGCKDQPDQERQNRRQFFNGLGKWSLAVIAAISALREGMLNAQDGIGSRFGTGSDTAGDTRQQIARHGNVPHSDSAPSYLKYFTNHANHANGPFQD